VQSGDFLQSCLHIRSVGVEMLKIGEIDLSLDILQALLALQRQSLLPLIPSEGTEIPTELNSLHTLVGSVVSAFNHV